MNMVVCSPRQWSLPWCFVGMAEAPSRHNVTLNPQTLIKFRLFVYLCVFCVICVVSLPRASSGKPTQESKCRISCLPSQLSISVCVGCVSMCDCVLVCKCEVLLNVVQQKCVYVVPSPVLECMHSLCCCLASCIDTGTQNVSLGRIFARKSTMQ